VLTSRSTVRRGWCSICGCNEEGGQGVWAVCYSPEQARHTSALDPSNTLLIRKGVGSGRKADREMVFRNNTRVAYASPHR
jgi:hypothetical protein